MKIRFTNKHTGNSTPTLNINGQGAKSIIYDGSTCSSTNTWEAGETVECYYDGFVYQLNNVAGGGTFKTGEKVKNVGIDSEPIAGSENLVKSDGVLNLSVESMSMIKLKFDSNKTISNFINTVVGHTYQIEIIENTTSYSTYHIWLNKKDGEEITTIKTWPQNFDISNFKYSFKAESNGYYFNIRGSSDDETHIKITDITKVSSLNSTYSTNIENIFAESENPKGKFIGDVSAPNLVNGNNPAYFSQWEPLDEVSFLVKIENLVPSNVDDYIEVAIFNEDGYFENLYKVDVKANSTSVDTNICVPKGYIVGLTEYGSRFKYRILNEGEVADVQCKSSKRESNNPLVDRPYTYSFSSQRLRLTGSGYSVR